MLVWQTFCTCSTTLSSHSRSAAADLGGAAAQRMLVFLVHVLHVAQPVVRQPDARAAHRGLHAAAAIVAHDDDVFDLEDVDGELHDRQAVQVGVHHHVGDVAMNEHFAGQQSHDLVGRHAAVGAADPQVGGRLLPRELDEEFRVLPMDAIRPFAIVLEELVEGSHVAAILRVKGVFEPFD